MPVTVFPPGVREGRGEPKRRHPGDVRRAVEVHLVLVPVAFQVGVDSLTRLEKAV